jgi:hypothetical protein
VTVTTPDDIEAAMWRAGLTRTQVAVLLPAVDAYATAQAAAALGAIDNYRRNPELTVHYRTGTGPACRCKAFSPLTTPEPADVTCGSCKATRAWKAAT